MTNSDEFFLMTGGPLYQLLRRGRLTDEQLRLLRRRVVVATLLAWLPLLFIAAAEGNLWHGSSSLPFLLDIQSHARLLIAIPLLLVAEVVVNDRLRSMVAQFVERNLLPENGRAAFDAAVTSAIRLRDSQWAELCLLLFVYVIGVGLLWRTQMVVEHDGWYGKVGSGVWQPTWAGWWLICVSLPMFQFLLVRWYYRIFIWSRFLWQVSRMHLRLVPTHPDRLGGLGFLASVGNAFSLLLLAQGAVLAGIIADKIFFGGGKLIDFKVDLVTLVLLLVFAILGPTLVFTRQLAEAKRKGLREYGVLAQRYVRDYDQKWLRGRAPPGEALLGSSDIQSLADLGNSFELISRMRLAPFTWDTVLQLAFTTLIPALPLTLTMISVTDLLERVLKMLF